MRPYVSTAVFDKLNSFDSAARLSAVKELARQIAEGSLVPPPAEDLVNVHLHSFHSYSSAGYSPSRIVWEGRRRGLKVVGVTDFDVLDALEETLAAGRALGIRATFSMETRAYAATYFDRELSSPGEPGVVYVLGMGFARPPATDSDSARFIAGLKVQSRARNIAMLKKVNPAMAPVELDYDNDVLPLTPSDNPTERHLCAAYDEKARKIFTDSRSLAAYWSKTLGLEAVSAEAIIHDAALLQNTIRSKMMKSGGPGYSQPDSGSFPNVREVYRMVRDAGAIPCLAWLDGLSAGESNPDELLDDAIRWGARIANIIPDRNWNISDPDLKAKKLTALDRFMQAARRRHIPVAIGTEMNSPGQRFVDDFEAPELAPYIAEFMDSAYLLYGHTVLEGAARCGLMSDWAETHFKDNKRAANDFFTRVGRLVEPENVSRLTDISGDATPDAILAACQRITK